ncbi:hypothetical protein [Streptomyces sp. SID13031]|uniref:hypothetical protein n=1 Tax=Streptomyces sp. SID13031 TaxID=2706046 RepID=UPI0013C90E48|nr:hypothetical protein [Streptomyces sp. SID13031]NEA31670.1 hypothetical protein [Streptomyces sp. SID13031]
MSSDPHADYASNLQAEIQRMLATDIVVLAARSFVALFPGVYLGRDLGPGKIRKWLREEFGKPRWTETNTYAFDALTVEIELIYERARVAARKSGGQLILLPRGLQLLAAPDPVAALRELL